MSRRAEEQRGLKLKSGTFWMMTTKLEGQKRATAETTMPSSSFEISSSSIPSIFVAIDSEILREERKASDLNNMLFFFCPLEILLFDLISFRFCSSSI